MKQFILLPLFTASLLSISLSEPQPILESQVRATSYSMPRTQVRSSNIVSIGYDESALTLEVEFVNGSVYQYYGVPRSIYEGLMGASSHGGYLDARVKDAGYRYRRVK